MKDFILIPEDRKNILKKEVIGEIEKNLNVKINLTGNSVEIENEGLEVYLAKNIIKAIGRGFSPINAFRLFDENNLLDLLELPGNEKNIRRIKSRLIGTNGKTRKLIEQYSGCVVSVYGKTVGIIGSFSQIKTAREAVGMIIGGAPHSAVYKFLEKVVK